MIVRISEGSVNRTLGLFLWKG